MHVRREAQNAGAGLVHFPFHTLLACVRPDARDQGQFFNYAFGPSDALSSLLTPQGVLM